MLGFVDKLDDFYIDNLVSAYFSVLAFKAHSIDFLSIFKHEKKNMKSSFRVYEIV